MADKKEYPAQEVQKANRPIENGCRQEQETDPRKIAAVLYAKTQEIEILLSKGSNPDRIAHCYKSAAADARRIAELTGNVKYLHYAAQLEQGAEISPFTEQTAEPDNHRYIFTPDGKEYVLPEQEAEYMRDNPIAAAILADEQKQAAQEVQHITIDLSNIDPRTDPNSPEFDIEVWKAALNAAGGIEAARERMEAVKQHLQQTVLSAQQITQTTGIAELVAENLQRTVSNAIKSISAFINSDVYKAIKDNMSILAEYIEQNREEIAAAADSTEFLQELTPYIQEEIEALKNDPAFAHASITDLMQPGTDADGNPTKSKWQMILAAARERKAAADAEREAQQEEPAQEVQENPALLQLQFFGSDAERQEEPAQEVQEATREEKHPSKLKNAEQSGAIMTIGERLFIPSDAEYQNAFTTSITAKAGLFKREIINGKPQKRELALDIPITFIQGLAKTVYINYISGVRHDTGIKVYFPSFIKELGIDINSRFMEAQQEEPAQDTALSRAEARETFIHRTIAEIDNIWGMLPNDSTEYKLIAVHAYNPETEELTINAPYLQQLIGAMAQKEERQLSSGAKYYNWSCDLLHSSAANERNQAAVEMATRLLVGVQQRGMTPDSKLKQNRHRNFTEENKGRVTWKITCAGLIEECPQIRERLKQQKTASEKTQTMKRTFSAMYRILEKKTDLFSYYADVSITKIIPTTKTVESEIVISHSGGNPKYKRPYLPLIEEQPQEVQPNTEEPEN